MIIKCKKSQVNIYGNPIIGKNTKIGAFVEIQGDVSIGDFCAIQSHSFICDGVTIGDNVFIGHGVMFINDLKPEPYNEEYEMKETLIENELKCYYCIKCVYVLYKSVREPKQWSVERMNNKYGHNKNNITIACLECNMKRRTIYHERFRFTKQLIVQKMD